MAETAVPAFCTQCRSRCGCTAFVEEGRLLRIEPDPTHPSGEKLCPKGRAAPELVHHPDRLTHPLRRVSPKGAAEPRFEPVSWDEALDAVAAAMAAVRDRYGPEQVAFGVTTPSGSHMSDGIAWVERFIRAFGSPNTIYATEICNWSKDHSSCLTYGWDTGTPDFARCDLAVLWGWNPAATWLARSGEVQKAMRRGARLFVVDPRPTLFARRADVWLRVRPGTDQALALGLAHLLIASGRFDEAFARRWTNAAFLVRVDDGRLLRESNLREGGDPETLLAAGPGGALLRYHSGRGEWLDDPEAADLRHEGVIETAGVPVPVRTAFTIFAEAAAAWPPARVAEVTGVSEADLARAADLIAESPRIAYGVWNGVGQSETATQTDRAISILYSLTGSYGDAGGNVPGAAAPFADISGQDLLGDAQRAKALGIAERPLGPGRFGWVTARDVWRAAAEGAPYPVRMLVSFGGNLLASQPDLALARRALAALEMHVHVDFFLNETAREADYVLPAATSWEREGLRAGFDVSLEGLRRVQLRPAAIPPVGEARSDVDVALALAARLGLEEKMFGCDADAGHAHHLAPAGIGLEALRAEPAGVDLPGPVPLRPYASAGFPTPTRRIEIYSETLLAHGQPPVPALAAAPGEAEDADFPLRLGGAKTVAYCHSQGRNLPSLRRLAPDPVLEMAPETAASRGLAEGDWAEVRTRAGRFLARARIVEGLEPGAVFAQHGWAVPVGAPGAGAAPLAASLNAAAPTDRADPVSGSLPLRAMRCEIARAG